MSYISELKYRIQRPRLLLHTVNVLLHKTRSRTGSVPDGIDVMDRDWDNLIILDSCRYDSFKQAIETRDIEGELNEVNSGSPHTNIYLRNNLHRKTLHDTVYVSTSPHLEKSQKGEFRPIDVELHDEYHVWRDSYHPTRTTDVAIEASETYPNKRLIVHYLPPHTPYLDPDIFDDYDGAPYNKILTGEIEVTEDDLIEAYENNLRIGLDEVETLLPHLDGKTVITADHGQLLGDREWPLPVKGYGHPELYIPKLLRVPWMEVAHSDRKRVVPEPPTETQSAASDEARDALKDLGYL